MRNPFAKSYVQRFDAAWRKNERTRARDIAVAWIESDPPEEKELSKLSLAALVHEVEVARASGDEERRIKVDMYLLARVPPRLIVGRMG